MTRIEVDNQDVADDPEPEGDPRLLAQEESDRRWANQTPEEAGVTESEPEPEIDYERIKRRWVIQRENKDFILFAGLMDLLHQESGGDFRISTQMVQPPSEGNGNTAIVLAVVTMGERQASGIGDANPGNVSRAMAPHAIRMAETRAKARALRDLLNVGLVAAEELGPSGPAPATDRGSIAVNAGTGQVEGIVVEGQRFTRKQVWEAYTARMTQMRDAGLEIPRGAALAQNAQLSQLVGATQNLKRKLAEAGKLAPSRNGS